MKKYLMYAAAGLLFPALIALADETPAAPAYSGMASVAELPEVSIIVDIKADFTDVEDDPNDEKLRVEEAELALSGYVYPSLRGDFIAALEQEYEADGGTGTEIDVEEAYLSFLDLPLDLSATVGRRLIPIGRTNPVHPHHWRFSDTPLPLENLFGDHPWYDDGVELSWLVPAGDVYLKVSAGVWNGRSLAHDHGHDEDVHDDHAEEDHDHDGDAEHEDEADHDHEEHEHGSFGEDVIAWDGHVFTGRIFADLPAGERLGLQLGGSVAADEGGNMLQAGDITLLMRWPDSYRRLILQAEAFRFEEDETGADPFGWFAQMTYAPGKFWEFGGRYDWTELLADPDEDGWAAAGFLTRYLTHTTYLRGQYRYSEIEDVEENLFTLQLVWGIGPHSHRLQD